MKFYEVSEEMYFSRPGYFGSTEYSTYKTQGSAGLAEYFLSKAEASEAPGPGMIFGRLFHGVLSGQLKLTDFEDSRYKTTSQKDFESNLIGSNDKKILQKMLRKFPIDLEKIRQTSEIYGLEKGYFFEFENGIELRVKPDLIFKQYFSDELIIVDWKTTSGFSGGSFAEKYAHQGRFYAYLMSKIHPCEKVRHVIFWLSKDSPYFQNTETLKFNKAELEDVFFISDLNEMRMIFDQPENYYHHNVNVNDEVLLNFIKTKWN